MNYSKAIAACSVTLTGAVALGAAAFSVHAQSIAPVASPPLHVDAFVTRSVTYADLDLALLPNERILNHRVRGAISSLCSEASRFDGTTEANDLMAECDHA